MDTGSGNDRRLRGIHSDNAERDTTQDIDRGELDFGSFVSRSVKSTSDRFRGSDAAGGESFTVRARGTASDDVPQDEELARRPSRKWRDSVDGGTSAPSTDTTTYAPRSRRFIDDAPVDEEIDDVPHRSEQPAWWSTVTRNEDGEQDRNRLILLALALLLLIALVVFGLSRLFGGDDEKTDDDPTPTPTEQEEDGDLRFPVRDNTPEADEPTEPAPGNELTPTPRVRDGGDNTLPNNHRTVPVAEVTLDGITYILVA